MTEDGLHPLWAIANAAIGTGPVGNHANKLAGKAMDSGIDLAAFPNRTNRVNDITSGGIMALGDLGLSSPTAANVEPG